jgi:hypothetical protein
MDLQHVWKLREAKYLEAKEKEKKKFFIDTLTSIGYELDKINIAYDNKYIERIQYYFKKYSLFNKQIINGNDIFGYHYHDIVKLRVNNDVYGYHYLQWQKQFDIRGYSDIKFDLPIEINNLRRINKNIKDKSKYKYQVKNNFTEIQGFYIGTYIYSWEFSDIFSLLESRGIQKLSISQDLFNNLLDYDPGVYAIEIITNDPININRSYCIFDDFPTLDEEIIQIPIGVYNQLKITPNTNDFKLRIVKPEKGTRIKIKCFIDPTDLFEDIKNQLTIELTKHKIISLNQIICVETDIDHSVIPFLVTELLPNNIIDITDIDLEIDFDECFNNDNVIESLFLYFNSSI